MRMLKKKLIAAATPPPWRAVKILNDFFVEGDNYQEILSAEDYDAKEADCELICYLRNSADAIAQLIDAARSQHQACASASCVFCNALSKLEK